SCTQIGKIYGEVMPPTPESRQKAIAHHQRACDIDGEDRWGCLDLGDALRKGYGGGEGKDLHKAIAAYGRACEGGVGFGCFMIGELYQTGEAGIQADERRAAEEFRKGCDRSSDDSCISLSEMVRAGRGGYEP